MLVPIINVVLGLILIVGGASGELGLLGSSSQTVPVIAGVAITIYGVIQVVREVRRTR